MSYLTARTKKVTTYGKKNKTRIINIHADLTPDRPTSGSSQMTPTKPSSKSVLDLAGRPSLMKLGRMSSAYASENDDVVLMEPTKEALAKPAAKPAAKVARRPLQAKNIQDTPTTPVKAPLPLKPTSTSTPIRKQHSFTKILESVSSQSSSDDEPVLRKRAVRRRRVVIPRSPSASPGSPRRDSPPHPKATRSGHPLRQVHIPSPMRGAVTTQRTNFTERLAAVEIGEMQMQVDEPAPVSVRPSRRTSTLDQVVVPGLPSDLPEVLEMPPPPTADPMVELLNHCSYHEAVPFESIFTLPALVACLPGHLRRGSKPIVNKIGEASFSEVFSVKASDDAVEAVVKIIPLLDGPSAATPSDSNSETEEFPECSEITEVVREIKLTRHMGFVPGGGFIDFLGAFVVQGAYPKVMLTEWDAYDERSGSENIRPDAFTAAQRYVFLVLSDGGDDLESYQFDHSKGWVQAAAVFWQVADALARAEEWTKFEHRDLHEGQILVAKAEMRDPFAPVANYLDPDETAVRTTVIDFGLSRLQLNSAPIGAQLPAECYAGRGEQWNVYRAMRALIEIDGDDTAAAWDNFFPRTNVLWLHYLCRRLLHFTKTLRKAVPRRASSSASARRAPAKDPIRVRCDAAYAMLTTIEREILGTASAGAAPKRGRKPQQQQSAGFASAGDVMAWGRIQGWVA